MFVRFSNPHSEKRISASVLTVSLCLLTPGWGHADLIEFEASTTVSSSSIDRGETLALTNNETEILIIKPTQLANLSAGLSRITPFGCDGSAFDDELGFSIGAGFETSSGHADLNVSYLNFPDSDEPPSIELGAELGLAQTFSPTLALFYDLRSDTHGAEIALSHPIENSLADVQLVLRGGFVHATEQDYSYIGLEGVSGLYEGEHIAVEAFLRGEASDEETFVSDIGFGGEPNLKTQAWAIGIRLTSTGDL